MSAIVADPESENSMKIKSRRSWRIEKPGWRMALPARAKAKISGDTVSAKYRRRNEKKKKKNQRHIKAQRIERYRNVEIEEKRNEIMVML